MFVPWAAEYCVPTSIVSAACPFVCATTAIALRSEKTFCVWTIWFTALATRNCDDPRIDYKDSEYLAKFLTPQAQILSRKRTGYCTQCQRQLKIAIKRARHIGLLPFVG
jgi:ribosomal protein S18